MSRAIGVPSVEDGGFELPLAFLCRVGGRPRRVSNLETLHGTLIDALGVDSSGGRASLGSREPSSTFYCFGQNRRAVQCSAVQFRFMSHIIGRAMRVRYPSSKAPAYNADEGYSVFTVVCLEGA